MGLKTADRYHSFLLDTIKKSISRKFQVRPPMKTPNYLKRCSLIRDAGLSKLLLIKYFYCIILIFVIFDDRNMQKLNGNFILQKN